ncbi:MAG: glycosyltransferase family 2 protein [Oligoflexia bacterium]|nr:glycosyltransferase family 2 protein [Oligoflexia bacterium]
MHSVSILIPVYNEEQILESALLRLHAFAEEQGIAHEILVTSNGSTDNTKKIGSELARTHSWLRFFSIPERSVGKAFQVNVENAKNEYLVCLDVDLSSELIFLRYACDLLQHADMLVGSKTMGSQRRSALRVLGSQLYITFTLLAFNLTVSDYSIGSKAFRRSAILPVLSNLDRWTGYIFELCLYLRLHGRKIIQIGIDCDDRRSSRFNLMHEGFYRYLHLYRCWRLMHDKQSWIAK